MTSSEEEATLSIPSLAFVAFLSFFIIRYFVSSRSADSGTATSRRNGQRFTSAQVEQVAVMFPQLSRRDIMWDLQRNGGSVGATTERVLGGGGLDRAPPSFQPVVPVSINNASSVAPAPTLPKAAEPDLITRYNLQSRISSKGKEKEEPSPATGWASSKEKRHEMLQRRRDEMILAARRRMQEKDTEVSG